MATRTRTSAPKTAPAPTVTPTAATNGTDLYASLAAGAKVATALPQRTRRTATNPLAALVARSYTDGQVFELPPVNADDKEVARIKAAVRRAALGQGLGVSLRHEVTDNGQVIVFLQGKDKAER